MVRLFAFITLCFAVFTSIASDTTTGNPFELDQSDREPLASHEPSLNTSPQQNSDKDLVVRKKDNSTQQLETRINSVFARKESSSKTGNESNFLQSVRTEISSLDKISSAKKVANLMKKKYVVKKTVGDEEPQSSKSIHEYLNEKNGNVLTYVPDSSSSGFHNTWPQYLKDGAFIVPPFPELYDGSRKHQLTSIASHETENPETASTTSNAEEMPNISESKLKIFEKQNSRPLERRISDFFLQPKQLSPKEEEIFQSRPLKKYDLHPVPPFAELHTLSQNPEHGERVKNEDVPLLMPEESNIPQRAGHELYPSSVFETELRVPFF